MEQSHISGSDADDKLFMQSYRNYGIIVQSADPIAPSTNQFNVITDQMHANRGGADDKEENFHMYEKG